MEISNKNSVYKDYLFSGLRIQANVSETHTDKYTAVENAIPMKALSQPGVIIGNRQDVGRLFKSIALVLSDSCACTLVAENKPHQMRLSDNMTGSAPGGAPSKDISDYPFELFSIGERKEVHLYTDVANLGPATFSFMVNANMAEEKIIEATYVYCSDNRIPATTLDKFVEVIKHLQEENSDSKQWEIFSPEVVTSLILKIKKASDDGAGQFLRERTFDVEDFIFIDPKGRGGINLLNLHGIQNHSRIYTSFIIQLITRIYLIFPELGQKSQPKLVVLIPNSEILFSDITTQVLEQLTTIIRGLAEKGVGLFFGVENDQRIPEKVRTLLRINIQMEDLNNDAESQDVKVDIGFADGTPDFSLVLRKNLPDPFPETEQEEDAILQSSRLFARYNTEQDQRTAYQIVLSSIAEQAQNRVVPKEDFRKPEEHPEPGIKESHGFSRLLKRILGSDK